ncbi:ABC transporter ATP-binding protein [Clostridium algidicarnis]|uniref:ABC transporter ATP-binding protein n=1 Tax=Clostridium algidicarnis TaxID=37659 RepID=UPI00049522F4|nr:ABC transporter ATP-binding protein [Clostridium algidicarnis]
MKKYLLKYKLSLFISINMVIVSSVINVFLAFVFKSLIDVTISDDLNKFYKVAIFSLVFIILGSIINWLAKKMKYSYMKKTLVFLKDDIFNTIIKKDIASFTSENSASYMSIISNDLKLIEADYFKNIFSLIKSFTLFILSLISLFFLSYKIAIILIILSLLTMIIPKFYEKMLSKCKKDYSDSLSAFTIKIKDIFTGFDVIKSFKIEEKICDEYSAMNNLVEDNNLKFKNISNRVELTTEIVGGLMFLSIFIIGSYLTIKGDLTLGTMVACIQLTNNIVSPIYMCIEYISNIKSIKEITNKILNINTEPVITNKFKDKKEFKEEIVLKNVSFEYKENKPVLKNINLKMEKGKKYAFVGMSGSGKSTILKLLLKQYEDFKGSILIDDINFSEINRSDIYDLISIIHQNVFLFDNTVENNITLFTDYPKVEINSAIKLSGLNDLIENLSKGVESLVGENGNLISGGEKQRISIARALIRKTPILILDEAMASLDNETAYSIENTVLNMENITAIVVMHRLTENLLKKYDKIFTLKNGQIIEEGTFEELINLNGYFYNLFSIGKVDNNQDSIKKESDNMLEV